VNKAIAASIMTATLVTLLSCAPTRNEHIESPPGRIYQRIFCKNGTPGKCIKRAREVCDTYSVIEPIHEVPSQMELTMTVECLGHQ
jgi:hypothetical protein